MNRLLYPVILFAVMLSGCAGEPGRQVTFTGGTSRWIFSNGIVNVVVKPARGIYEIFRTSDQKLLVSEAYLKIGNDSTNEPLRKADYSLSEFVHRGDTGKFLLITSSIEGGNGLGLRFGLLPGKDFVVIDAGIMNRSSTPLQIKDMSVITRGRLYGGRKLAPNFRMLDGNGGGESTLVTAKPALDCRNNFLLTWGEPDKREVMVAGGLTYSEVEKFVRITTESESASSSNDPLPSGLKPLVRLDAGRDGTGTAAQVSVKVARGTAYRWESGSSPEFDDILFDREEVVLAVTGLSAGKDYTIGVAWSDDADTRNQSVSWSVPGSDPVSLLAPHRLPSHAAGKCPEYVWLNLPQQASAAETLLIHILNEGGVNAVLSDFRLCSGIVGDELNGVPQAVAQRESIAEELRLDLFASDPVGKRIDPGQSWFPEDAFYLSAGSSNPYDALEKYGDALKEFQAPGLEYYTFPTVCLWYAQHPAYGGGPSVNDSRGAVEEMDRALKSGFLRYAPVSVRLVPDAYEQNNEQGWWDEKHWQMYGTGRFANPPDRNVDVPPGHYKKPFETTRKWAQAIRERGGIPLTYFQTGRRSDDYAATYPEQMLFNGRDTSIPDPDWMISGKPGYDFTDRQFLAHMEEVYANLADGGVQGLMYDYPYTAWARFGGMDDVYSTTAAAYRTVFQLARTGLGPEAFLDERNLDHGSDLTLGIVSSQRIWGDTDGTTPLMFTRGALRWYKNRKVVSYDMDAKNLLKVKPQGPDGVRKLLTLMYVTCGRFLMANSFDRLPPELVRDLGRIFPYPDQWLPARPADAFSNEFPRLYTIKLDDSWHQVALYNPNDQEGSELSVYPGSPDYFGAFSLDPGKTYYAYEFWDDRLAGTFRGDGKLTVKLRPGEAKMIAVREMLSVPQLLSSDRHIMQGWYETRSVEWNAGDQVLSGGILLPDGEPVKLTFATNGHQAGSVSLEGGSALKEEKESGLLSVTCSADKGGWHIFAVQFKKK